MGSTGRSRILLGGGAMVSVVVFLAIIVAVQYIALQHPKRWDVTKTGKFTLAPQSKKVLETYKDKSLPIQVLAFFEAKELNQKENVRDLFDQYRDLYSGFTYSFIDPDQNRAEAIRNKVDTYPTIVIKSGAKDERLTAATEENITNALVKLMRTETKKVYFLKGHGEQSITSAEPEGFSVAKEQIEKQNYKTDELVLLQSPQVPDDATMLIITGPQADPIDAELESLKKYLDRGGSLFVLLNPFKTPKLAAFLKDYGFEIGDDIIIDRMSRVFGGDYLIPVITTYVKFPITKDFTLASFFPQSRSVKAAAKPAPKITAQDLALTSPVSWTIDEEQFKSGNANFEEKTGQKGPISVMAVSTVTIIDSKKAEGEKPIAEQAGEFDEETTGLKKTRIVVAGSALFASNKIMQALQANKELFMNTVSWLAEDENLIAIRPKSTRAEPIILTGNDIYAIFLIPVVIVPLMWIIAGLWVMLARRRMPA